MPRKQKLFIVRKYVLARNAAEALRLEKKQPGDDVWLDDDWKKSQTNSGAEMFALPRRSTTRRPRA